MFKNRALQIASKLYGYFITVGNNLQSLFLLWMRLTWGHQFILTGMGKLSHIDKVIQYFTTLGIANPEFHAYLVGYVELVGGILMVLGLFSRITGLVLASTMIAALASAEHAWVFSEFRFIYEPSSLVTEAPYPFLITSLLLFFFGPGRLSIDAWIKRWVEKQPKY
jgi:putative oxidoreductase